MEVKGVEAKGIEVKGMEAHLICRIVFVMS